MNRKGFLVLEGLISNKYNPNICFVESRRDKKVKNDYFLEIKDICNQYEIPFFDKRENNVFIEDADWKLAIGWRWLIRNNDNLIILHDSLLPKYRGFAPLVNALINGEEFVGVTALVASESYDRGDIILQKKMKVDYPAKIINVIEEISQLYISVANKLFELIGKNNPINTRPQDETKATYSIWRDEKDYFIDWSRPAEEIKRFVDAVGFPYKGAVTILDDKEIEIRDSVVKKGVTAEINHPGKVIFLENKCPVVLCGKDALLIKKMICAEKAYELTRLKSRFK